MSLFNTKFFWLEAKFTLAKLGQTCQYPGEELDAYIRRFYEKAMDYYDPMSGDVVVDVCLLA